MCYPIQNINDHNCKTSLKNDICCICYEDFFNSRDPIIPFG